MTINEWYKLTDRQRVIRMSMYSYFMVLCDKRPVQFLEWEEK